MLTDATVKAALAFAAGKLATAGSAVGLAEGVLQAMWMTRVKVWLAALVLVLAVTGAGLLAFGRQPGDKPAQQQKGDPVPEAVGADQLKQLAEARLDAARTAYEAYWLRYQVGMDREEAVHLWSRRLLQAQFDLSDKKADRDVALAAYQERLKKTDEIARSRLVLGNSPVFEPDLELQPPPIPDEDVKNRTPREKFETTWEAYQHAKASDEQVCLASVRWLMDQHRARRTIKGIDVKAELQAHLDRIKRVELIAKALFEAGATANMDYRTALFFRLQAEEWLAQGKTFEKNDLEPGVSSK